MFVRWKRRKRQTTPNRSPWATQYVRRNAEKAGDSLDAVIVENAREAGRVRQKVICYLGSVHEKTAHELHNRVYFWERVSAKLDRLSLQSEERKRLEVRLHEIIPFVSVEEQARFKTDRDKRLKELTTTILAGLAARKRSA